MESLSGSGKAPIDFEDLSSIQQSQFCDHLVDTCPYFQGVALPFGYGVVIVGLIFRFKRLIEVNENGSTFSLQGNVVFQWPIRECFQTASENYNIKFTKTGRAHATLLTRLAASSVWVPPIGHINAVGAYNSLSPSALQREMVYVTTNGHAFITVTGTFTSICSMAFRNFPNDIQECQFDLGSFNVLDEVSYDIDFVSVENVTNSQSDVGRAELSNENWSVIRSTVEVASDRKSAHVKVYLRRKPIPLICFLFLPPLLLAILQVGILFFPPEMSARSNMSMTVFIATIVLLNFIFNKLPNSSEILPVVIFYLVQIAIGIAAIVYMIITYRIASNQLNNCGKLECCRTIWIVDMIDVYAFCIFIGLYYYSNLWFLKAISEAESSELYLS